MSIRVKIVLIVLPLLIVALVIGGLASFFSATTGVTRVTVELLDFKTSELEKYVVETPDCTFFAVNFLDKAAFEACHVFLELVLFERRQFQIFEIINRDTLLLEHDAQAVDVIAWNF